MRALALVFLPGMAMADPAVPQFVAETGGVTAAYEGDYYFMVGGGPVSAAINLAVGFLGLLLLDLQFWQKGLAPPWWMSLRLLLTSIVVLTLLVVIL